MRPTRARLHRNERGMAATEFALITPVFLALLLGVMDMGHTLYMTSVLQGIVQKAGRDSSLENGTETAIQDAINQKVIDGVHRLAKNADVVIDRRYFKDFTKAQQAVGETFTDTNHNGVCDAGEPYQDNNNNMVRDADGGDSGQGGAKDIVMYTVDVTYPRLFPMGRLIGLPATVDIHAATALANQPYGDQSQYTAPTVRNCP